MAMNTCPWWSKVSVISSGNNTYTTDLLLQPIKLLIKNIIFAEVEVESGDHHGLFRWDTNKRTKRRGKNNSGENAPPGDPPRAKNETGSTRSCVRTDKNAEPAHKRQTTTEIDSVKRDQ
jgi:hypothetical protein